METENQKRQFLRNVTAAAGLSAFAAVANAAVPAKAGAPRATEDEAQIASLLVRWGYARDSDDWETLRQCFHDDATIHISWISAPAKDFVERSKLMAAARKPGAHLKHIISPPWVRINKNRAFSRTHATLFIREDIEGQGADITSWIRFFDQLERRDGVWRIVKRVAVYEKDRIDPVDPRGFPAGFFNGMDLSKYPPTAKFLSYWLERIGRPSDPKNIIPVLSEAERNLKQEFETWMMAAK
ncbi:MAG: nuclear transport factor 2 family protein [Glaciimonas sp.]|nr:nuclear transport factor 2 family protein [Glaciimonas sp.]